ncbi:hypothetical protein K505DRAFT_367182 [Melanomma pulvis-pyrius CBS 109.77]|uniref:Rhodopsin domain-containing protein n=1 Tax=Melanomma pulvis-pyrius CBS 109.77 TaxID=1314802 RepID=A0A6A6WUQ3_9PLEO|nr:hypothetical protein K505DRAFT_367182 [Melanomma pulvis-pyrius CBS 109.77]
MTSKSSRFLAMESSSAPSSPFGTYRARVILGVVVAFTLTSTASLVLRFVGKRIKSTQVSSEDWIIIAAQVAVYALAITSILEVVLGNAGHLVTERPSKVPDALKLLIAVQCLYAISLGLVKVSICLFYNRIFDFRSFHIASWTIIAVVISWISAVIVYAFVTCRPLAFFWDPTIQGGSCVSHPVIPYIVLGVLDVVVDIFILALPLPLLCKLRVSPGDKVALFCIFGAGICTMVISILRVEALANLSFNDVTYTGAYSLVWSFMEPAIGISVACAPFFRPLIRRAFPNTDIELGTSYSKFHRLQPAQNSLPSFVNPNIRVARGNGKHGSFITTQVLEPGNWSTASHCDV